ncbi:MAG: hypothetical protein QOG64_2066, partial [Acidimicrobiaceae bacterium]|nr:hypothetical protein [Acidimicrobiaceae bacterium]
MTVVDGDGRPEVSAPRTDDPHSST